MTRTGKEHQRGYQKRLLDFYSRGGGSVTQTSLISLCPGWEEEETVAEGWSGKRGAQARSIWVVKRLRKPRRY